MLTAGVDLAAEPKGTALALIEWSTGGARVVELEVGVGDEPIVQVASRVDKLGIDCALGWPREFVDFVTVHSDVARGPVAFDGGMEWRRRLAYRETDRHVREQTGRWPLSVSTDRLGLTAMRCAGLLSRMDSAGLDVDRSGSGTVVEVYPGASLRQWGFDTTGYRVSLDARARLVALLREGAAWLEIGPFAEVMMKSADALDAVIASLAARASVLEICPGLPTEHAQRARTEGWIALPPVGSLSELVSGTERLSEPRSAPDEAEHDAELA